MKNIKNKIILLLLLVAILVGAGFYFLYQRDFFSEPIQDAPLRIFYSEWPPDMIAYLAKEKGFFEKNNVDVELVWVEGFEDARNKRQNGETDIWNYTVLDLLTDYATGFEKNAQVFLLEDVSAGADAIVSMTANNIKTPVDLKGKKIGVEKGTISEFFLTIALQKAGLNLHDVTIVEVASSDVPSLLKAGTIDAGVTYQPYVTEVVLNQGNIIVDSEDERGVIVDVYVAKSEHIKKYPELYRRAMISLLEAGRFFKENPNEAADIMKEPLGMTREEVLEIFETLRIPDLRENETIFDRSSGYASLFNLGRLAQQFLEEQGVFSPETLFDFDPLINTDLIESIQDKSL